MSTGGPLNFLNGKYGISDPNRSVSVMKLIRTHHPKSRQELVDLISEHVPPRRCNLEGCRVQSWGSIVDFGTHLYNAQIREWKEHRFSLKQCIQWEYNLFIVNSLRGHTAEQEALNQLSAHLKPFSLLVQEASEIDDTQHRIDLLVSNLDGKPQCGIQVKPESYQGVRQAVKDMNQQCNQQWTTKTRNPVFYLYYGDCENQFVNLEQVVSWVQHACIG